MRTYNFPSPLHLLRKMAQPQHEHGSEQSSIIDQLTTWAADEKPAPTKEHGVEQYNKDNMKESLRDAVDKHIRTVRDNVFSVDSQLISVTDFMACPEGVK
jgi:hypothetical protein